MSFMIPLPWLDFLTLVAKGGVDEIFAELAVRGKV